MLNGFRSRWALAGAWGAGLLFYWAAVYSASDPVLMWINDAAWTLASALAAVGCFVAARGLEGSRRRAWLLLGCGCTSWFIGQMHWNYAQLRLGVTLPFPSVGQAFYSGFPVLAIAAVLQFPDSRQRTPFTFKKLGNIGLVACCLGVIVVLGIIEPALRVNAPAMSLRIALGHTGLVAGAFVVTLYALWTHRWDKGWTPMLILTIAASIYAATNLTYVYSLLTETYFPDNLINAGWLIVFGLIAVAAGEQRRESAAPQGAADPGVAIRQGWLEAIIPALLIIIMVLITTSTAPAGSRPAVYWSAGLFFVFALMLGAREAWIQNESQLLTAQLVATNERLKVANAELRASEARFRELNAELEQRVAERTAQLKAAYEEMEGFSYAVAHDLKAPLRAINSFAHLLEAEMEGRLTEAARDQLARIRNGSIKMATLIDDLLAYSQVDRRGLQVSAVSLPMLFDSVIAHYAEEIQRRRVAVRMDVEPITVEVDADGLALAVRNLLENALKYTRERPQPRIEIAVRRLDHCVLATFTDNGIGFDMEYHDHIFKIFQRLHRDDRYPGTGIGLALVRKAVERLGGRVWAQSKVGEGATFHVELPGRVVLG